MKDQIKLTLREFEVLQMICEEHTSYEIAQQLSLSPRTVEGYRNSLLSKTGSRNTVGLVKYALRNQIIEWD